MFTSVMLRRQCDKQKVLAFADDLAIIAENWGDLRRVLNELKTQIEPAGLEMNHKKCEILISRNRHLPTDTNDWLTDDDEQDPTMFMRETVPEDFQVPKKLHRLISREEKVPRTFLETFEGIKVAEKVKYLGLDISTNKDKCVKLAES